MQRVRPLNAFAQTRDLINDERSVLTNPSVSAQVSEMQLVREKVYAMEQTHMTLKQKYLLSLHKPNLRYGFLTVKPAQVRRGDQHASPSTRRR